MLLIWDLDGTLVDSRQDIASAANLALADLGRPVLPTDTVIGFVGDGIATLVERLTPGATAAERVRCRERFELHYAAGCCRATIAYPGIVSALTALRDAGHVQAVATNKALAFVGPILRHCGLAEFFAAVRGGDDRRKPDPWQLLDLARELGRPPAWMIGDHHTDLLAGRAAGARVLFCRWGLGHDGGVPYDAAAAAATDIPALITGPGA